MTSVINDGNCCILRFAKIFYVINFYTIVLFILFVVVLNTDLQLMEFL